MSLRNATRRRGRSLAATALIAAGLFIVAAVVSFTPPMPEHYTERASGTGGFALIGQTTLPVQSDLNTAVGRERFGLDEDELPADSIVPFRVSDGDDASCLNLNKTPRPRVIGVDPALLSKRDAFVLSSPAGWHILDETFEDGAIPAIADANTAQWALHLAPGDTFIIDDVAPGSIPNTPTPISGGGGGVRLRLVATVENSILQGSLIISEAHFRDAFPGTAGHRMFLFDVEPEQLEARQTLLSRQMEDVGLALEPTLDRLAAYNAVQETYLTIFQALGALGVTLGCVGLGVVVLRNLLERRAELAMLLALGLGRPRIRRIILIEHLGILILGLSLGTMAALTALTPPAPGSSSGMFVVGHLVPLLLTAGACILITTMTVLITTHTTLRHRLTEALRQE